jgi:hypothetical protein
MLPFKTAETTLFHTAVPDGTVYPIRCCKFEIGRPIICRLCHKAALPDTWHSWLRGRMIQVYDLNSAFAALDIIVGQGEGHDKHVEGSHYEIFNDLTKITDQIVCYLVVENSETYSYKGEKLYEVKPTLF